MLAALLLAATCAAASPAARHADDPLRPQLRYTPHYGWVNDPNGLGYYKGEWHFFCQHNPYGVKWGNMSWNHAVSKDLVRWTELGDVLVPDATGDMFSGSAVVDRAGDAGFGKDVQLLFYTAAGKPFTQRLAWSKDGRTYVKADGEPVLANLSDGNRDPKVFYHAPSKQWVMALYGDERNRHAVWIFNSTDLRHWTKVSTLTGDVLKGEGQGQWLYECPGLEELRIENETNTAWVVWGARHEYAVGSFDGRTFTPAEERIPGISGAGMPYYAAQTFNDVPDGRKLWVAWFRLPYRTGAMTCHSFSLIQELTLRRTAKGLRLVRRPARELQALRDGAAVPFDSFDGELAEVQVSCRVAQKGRLELDLRGMKLVYDAASETLSMAGASARWPLVDGRLALTVFIDRVAAEIFSADGLQMLPVPNAFPSAANRRLSVADRTGVTDLDLLVYRLKSIWQN